jgi:hypothetical protein
MPLIMRCATLCLLALSSLCSGLVHADATRVLPPAPVQPRAVPERAAWRASSSAAETPALASALAIDGDATTRWGGAFSAEHWLQIDLSEPAAVGGVLLHWDSGFAASYRILASLDGTHWQTVFETSDGQGGIDYVFFPSVQARYLRLASMPLSADWGVSLFEFEPLSAAETPRIEGLTTGVDSATLWGSSATPPRALGSARELTISLPRALPTTGLEVFWGAATRWRRARLDARTRHGAWRNLAVDNEASMRSLLAARKPMLASELRLTAFGTRGKAPTVRRLRLLPPDRTMTPLRRYEVAASRAHSQLFPLTLRNQQVYWTTIGVPAGRQKSIFDEFGDLEAWKGAPLVQPLWRDKNRRVRAAYNATPTQTLRDGWLPLPSVEWSPQPGLALRSEAFTIEHAGQPVTLLRHRLENTGTQRVDGELTLLVRPLQINPAWQSGGISPIHEVALEGPATNTSVRVNGRVLLQSWSAVQSRGAASFGDHGEGELTQSVVWGAPPTADKASDSDGLAAAALRYRVQLAPGERRAVVLAFPLGNTKLPDVSNADPDARFDELAAQVAEQWRKRFSQFELELPDHSLVDMLRAQLAYMLINQTGPAIQPGPRNYNRSFIRDGSATAHVLMRVGLSATARDYLRWYSDHALHENGLVSPMLNNDGTVNRGFGSDLEHDSQGQFVGLVADIARLDGGPETVREYLPKVRSALHYLEQLRDRTLAANYQNQRPQPARFRGIVAPSISHEGYSVPTHSYWDDYWALKGWHDGAWLASALGHAKLETWARAQYAVLRESVAASIQATMAWKGTNTVPAAADLGDFDPTSTSIALDPCGQQDLLPRAALARTFDRYLNDIRQRKEPGSLWAFTPYELRNVLTYVHLNRPDDANELLTHLLQYRRPEPWQQFAEVVHSRVRHPGYLGDMPHTWIGSEYVRTIFGMLMHEADDHLTLLPGAPSAWFAGSGTRIAGLRTAYGSLSMSAHQTGNKLYLTLGPGLRAQIPVQVMWPSRVRPQRVWVDGQLRSGQTSFGIRLAKPFKELVAEW